MKAFVTGILLLFCSTLYANPWQVVGGDSVQVFFSKRQETLAKKVAAQAGKILRELASDFNLPVKHPVAIFLVNDETTWRRLLGPRLPGWFPAVTKPELSRIYIRTFKQEKDWIEVLKHELLHAFLGMYLAPGSLPKWFEEGLAMQYSGENFVNHTTTLSKAYLTNSLLSLQQIEQVLQYNESKARLAYAESYLCVKIITQALGQKAVLDALRNVIQGEPWGEAFNNLLQMNEADFQEYAFQYVGEHYRWNFLFQSEMFWWFLLPFLVMLAYVVILMRRWKTYRRWDLEELEGYFLDESNGSEEQR